MTYNLTELLQSSSSRHDHLCPRQVLGVRMGLAGLAALGLEAPISKRTGLVIVETDGCFADGIEVSTGATVGHRTLRVNDLGKIAATFADIQSRRTIRLSPSADVRQRVHQYASKEERRYFAQLQGYQVMPDEELFQIQEVELTPPLAYLLGKPSARVQCDLCGEEIINERQVQSGDIILCRTCAQQGYYQPAHTQVTSCSLAINSRIN